MSYTVSDFMLSLCIPSLEYVFAKTKQPTKDMSPGDSKQWSSQWIATRPNEGGSAKTGKLDPNNLKMVKNDLSDNHQSSVNQPIFILPYCDQQCHGKGEAGGTFFLG